MSFTDAIQQHCIHRLLSIALVLISSTAISDAAASPLPRTEDNTRNITPFTPGTLTRSFSSILECKGRDRVHVKGKDCNNNKTGYPIPTANNGTLGPDQRLTGASNVQDTSKCAVGSSNNELECTTFFNVNTDADPSTHSPPEREFEPAVQVKEST